MLTKTGRIDSHTPPEQTADDEHDDKGRQCQTPLSKQAANRLEEHLTVRAAETVRAHHARP